jgi:outer membrane protein
MHSKWLGGSIAAAVCGILAQGAFAQVPPPPMGQPGKTWNVVLGAGAGVQPTYEGSDRYRAVPIPIFSAVWRDTVALDYNGLSAYWRGGGFTLGGGLTFDTGRSQSSSSLFQGDDRLYGLGDIPAALGVKAFASYQLGPVGLDASLTKLTANGNDGLLAKFGASVPYAISERVTLIGLASTTWANQSYMQTHFGVTQAQAANSGYAAYSASAGLKDVSVGLAARYRIDEHWLLSLDARASFLTNDAAYSPITRSNINGGAMAGIAYHF